MSVMGGFGGGGGGHFGGRADGLPFAGVPSELRASVEALVAKEPVHPDPAVSFQHRTSARDARPLTLRRLAFAHWRLGIGAVLLVGIISLADQAGPRLIVTAIDEGMVRHRSMNVVAVVSALYLAAILLTALCQRWLAKVSGRLAAHVMNDLRIRVFTHLQRLSLDFYTREKAGVVMTRMTSDIENLQQLLQDGLAQIAVQALTMVVITGLLLSMNVPLTLLMIGLTIPPLVAMSVWFRSRSEVAYQRVRDGIAAVLRDLSESLRGIRVVASHNRGRYNVVRHRNIVGDYRGANALTARLSSYYGPGTQLLGLLSQALLLGVGGRMVLHHSLTVGELVAFFLYFNRFFQPIQMLVQQYTVYQQSQSSILKLRALLAEQPAVEEAADAVELPSVAGEIRFEAVSFGYTDSPVLKGIDLTISPGETVAFVGPTGAGKSTLAKLVMRFYDATEGRVLVDGRDVREVSLGSLRRQVGLVPQEAFLFAGTLRDNIAFGRPSARDDEVTEAVAAVGLTALVERMPDGLDTEVHERGQSLSAGERQLVALARAFLAQPHVLVLDEATANLDLQSETEIEHALDALLRDRTAILIAHRLSTAMKSDRIVVVEDGRIAETGSPDELLSAGGRFAEMYEAWTLHAGVSAVTAA
jgi:ATP-binding cassette subfamily B protein